MKAQKLKEFFSSLVDIPQILLTPYSHFSQRISKVKRPNININKTPVTATVLLTRVMICDLVLLVNSYTCKLV